MLGGIARRATAISTLGTAPKLVIDTGNYTSNDTSEFSLYKADAVLDAYALMGYDAVNVGSFEITQGKAFILHSNEIMKGKVISANVLDTGGNPIVQPYVTKNYGSLKVGIIGLTFHQEYLTKAQPPDQPQPDVITRDPIEALEEYLPVMRDKDKCDIVVVAGTLQIKDVENIAEKFDGQVDVILNGYGFTSNKTKGDFAVYYATPENTTAPSDTAPQVARDESNKKTTTIFSQAVGQQGKYIGKIFAHVKEEGGKYKLTDFEGSTVEMSDQFDESPEVLMILDAFHQKVRDNRDKFVTTLVNQDAQHYWQDFPEYVGNRFCNECHPTQINEFNRSGHARAVQVLTRQKNEDNPDCLSCHTTAFGLPDGYKNRDETGHMASVNCEACHGAGREHIGIEFQLKTARDANGRSMATQEQLDLLKSTEQGYDKHITREVPEALCLKCHNDEWSPNFNYETYLKLVNHTATEEEMRARDQAYQDKMQKLSGQPQPIPGQPVEPRPVNP